MKFHELKTTKAKSSRRSGRGIAAGRGKTAGRGTKGQGARTGSSKKPGFEGGQNPLMQRLPKLRGFTSHQIKPETVNLSDLASLKLKTIDAQVLADKGLVSSPYVAVKVLSSGELKQPVTVKLAAATSLAKELIEQAGGEFIETARLSRPVSKEKVSRKDKKLAIKTAKK